ncbi:hypothetical protein [Amycolatopsis sp. NBC_01286]|uniref:hypothetical protein n=1 Tax=Amycolatopsis sp. NBC_01286 TaxID=2903560 RepID=UPI002E161FBE|nr:hypothetical protein OG570_00220 [Amycolatopsis sp. NBC_01286]
MPRRTRKQLVERTEDEDMARQEREVAYKTWACELACQWQDGRPVAEAGAEPTPAGLS